MSAVPSDLCCFVFFPFFFRVWIVVISSDFIKLAQLTLKIERSQKIDDLPILATCQSGTLAILFSEVNSLLPIEALGNAWYGSWRPLTNLIQACHLCTFNVATILLGSPYIWSTKCHDIVLIVVKCLLKDCCLKTEESLAFLEVQWWISYAKLVDQTERDSCFLMA